jgi:hypothetical protein
LVGVASVNRSVGCVRAGGGGSNVDAMNSPDDDHTFRLHALSNVRPLRPVRVLLSGRDPRYVRAMAFLLSRRGYETRRGKSVTGLFSDVEEFGPDVVVLVEGDSFGEAVGDAVALLGRDDSCCVIVATTRHDAPSANRLRFVEKWCSFDSFAEAVERAWAELPPAVTP